MKKSIAALAMLAVLAVPATVYAASSRASYTIPSDTGKVYRFDDGRNRCYVAKTYVSSGSSVSISCLRKAEDE